MKLMDRSLPRVLMVAIVTLGPWISSNATPVVTLDTWLDQAIDVQKQMSVYLLKLDTFRDVVELRDASATHVCDPARVLDSHRQVSTSLEKLAADQARVGLDQPGQVALSRVVKSWSSILKLQQSHFRRTSAVKDLDPKERCLRPSALTDVRIDLLEDFTLVLKAAAHKLAER